MGTTGTGLPYPEPTAQVRNGAADIKALADALTAQNPAAKLRFFSQSLTTNASGDIALPVPGVNVSGATAITWNATPATAGAYLARITGAPAATVWFRVFLASGAALVNSAVSFNAIVWGS
jgi:hypothetical protein